MGKEIEHFEQQEPKTVFCLGAERGALNESTRSMFEFPSGLTEIEVDNV